MGLAHNVYLHAMQVRTCLRATPATGSVTGRRTRAPFVEVNGDPLELLLSFGLVLYTMVNQCSLIYWLDKPRIDGDGT